MVLCLISAGIQNSGTNDLDDLDATEVVAPTADEQGQVPAEEGTAPSTPAEGAPVTE